MNSGRTLLVPLQRAFLDLYMLERFTKILEFTSNKLRWLQGYIDATTLKLNGDVSFFLFFFCLVSHVGAATYSLGQYLAPHIKEKGSQLLINVAGVDQNEASGKIDALFNVSASAVEGLTTVYQGLEQSARIFGGSLSNNTVQIVKHR